MQISVSSQTTLLTSTNFFVFALYDATAPTIVLESQQPAKPYGNPLQISFAYNCLSGHIYIIKLWESADSTPTGVVRNSFSQSVSANSVSVRLRQYLQVGLTPGLTAGATSYTDTSWVGWTYKITRNPNVMIPDNTTESNPNYHIVTTGGFNLIQTGDSFIVGEQFIVDFDPQIIVGSAGNPSSLFSSGRIITVSTTLTLSDIGTALLIQSATNAITVTLPALSTIADYSFYYIYSAGGSHINAVIQAPGADKFLYPSLFSQIILGQCEILKIFKANGVWNIENDLPGMKKVGELLYNYSLSELNTIQCTGSLLLRATYPRLWAWVQTLAATSVVTDSAWTSTFITVEGVNYYTKIGCFSTGDGSTNFRIPLITSFFLRPVDGSGRTPGSFEVQTAQIHSHVLNGANGVVGIVPGAAGNVSGGGHDGGSYAVINSGTYGATETKPSNIGVYALIRI